MTTAVAQLRGLRAWKHGVYQRIFAYMSPRISVQLKELIFVSSITGLIQNSRDPDLVLMKQMNRVFQLARHDDGFAYPVYVKSVIWHDYLVEESSEQSQHRVKMQDTLKENATLEDIREVGGYFAKSCPAWLKFASPELMVEVFVKLVNCVRRHQGLNQVRAGGMALAY